MHWKVYNIIYATILKDSKTQGGLGSCVFVNKKEQDVSYVPEWIVIFSLPLLHWDLPMLASDLRNKNVVSDYISSDCDWSYQEWQ